MNTLNIHKSLLFILIGILTILTSCKKTQEENIAGSEALLNVKLEGLNFDAEGDILASNQSLPEETTSNTHIQYVNKDFHIESQLIPVENKRTQKLKTDLKQDASAVLKELGENIKYKLLVYNANGNLVTDKDYVYKHESLESSIVLNTYTDYIFVVVSARSTSILPQIENINNLNNARISNVNADLLHWKSPVMRLNKGQNFLAAKLKPKFSEVTTTLEMDQTMTGAITVITNPTFTTVAQNVSLKLNDGTLTHGAVSSTGKAISFPALQAGLRSVTSVTPTTLIHNGSTAGSLKFGSIRVDGETKDNIIISGLSFKPGHRYNLILTLKTCTEAVNGLNGFNWDFAQTTKTIDEGTKWRPNKVTYTGIDFKDPITEITTFKKNGEIISFQFSEAGADYGFVYDIMELDNAFNLEINGTPLVGNSVTTDEIQFQNNATSTTQNIEFLDGSQYQSIDDASVASNKKVKAIWEFRGTITKPAIRVVIGRNGDVLIYGSKTDQGPLLPLRLKNGKQFNKVTWNGGLTGVNKIKATTRVEGKTTMKSSGSGRRKIPCPN